MRGSQYDPSKKHHQKQACLQWRLPPSPALPRHGLLSLGVGRCMNQTWPVEIVTVFIRFPALLIWRGSNALNPIIHQSSNLVWTASVTCASILNSTWPDSWSQSASTATILQAAPVATGLRPCSPWTVAFVNEAVAIARMNCSFFKPSPSRAANISLVPDLIGDCLATVAIQGSITITPPRTPCLNTQSV